jgi:hypothetical protein
MARLSTKNSDYGCPISGSCGDSNYPLDITFCRDYENCPMYQDILSSRSALKDRSEMGKPNLSESDIRLAGMSEKELEEHIEQQLSRQNGNDLEGLF